MHLSVCFYIPRCGITEFIVLSLFRHQVITSEIPKAHRRNVDFPFLLLYFISNCVFLYVESQMRHPATFSDTFSNLFTFFSSATDAVPCVKLFLLWDTHPMKL